MSASIAEQYSRLSSVDSLQKLGFLVGDTQEGAQPKSQRNNLSINPPQRQFSNTSSSATRPQTGLRDQVKNLLEVLGEDPKENLSQNPDRNPAYSDLNPPSSGQQNQVTQAKSSKFQHSKSPSAENTHIIRNIEYVHNLSAAGIKRDGSPFKTEGQLATSRSAYGQNSLRRENTFNKSTDYGVYAERGRVYPEKQPTTRWQKFEEQTREPLFNVKSHDFMAPTLNSPHKSSGNLNTQGALYNISRESGYIQAFYKKDDSQQINKNGRKKPRALTPNLKADRSYSPINVTHKEESFLSALINHTRSDNKDANGFGGLSDERNKYLYEGDVFYVSSNKIMGSSPIQSQKLTYDFNDKEKPQEKQANKPEPQKNKMEPLRNHRAEKIEPTNSNKVIPNQQQEKQKEKEKIEMMKYYQELQRRAVTEESTPSKTDRSMNNQVQSPVKKQNDVPSVQSVQSTHTTSYDLRDPNINRQLPVEPRNNGPVQNGASDKSKIQSGVKLSGTLNSPERNDAKLNTNANTRHTQPDPLAESQRLAEEREAKEKQDLKEKQEEERKKAQQRREMLRTVEGMIATEKKDTKPPEKKPEKKPETKSETKPAPKTEIPDITSIYGAEKKKPVTKPQVTTELPQKPGANNIAAGSKSENDTKANDTKANDTKANDTKANDTKANDTKANDPKQAADNKPADTKPNEGQTKDNQAKESQLKEAAGQQRTAAGANSKMEEKKRDPNKVEIDKETLAKLEAALAKSNDPKIQMVMDLIKRDPERFNKVLDLVEHPEKMRAEVQANDKKEITGGASAKRTSILMSSDQKRTSILTTSEQKRTSILATSEQKRNSILAASVQKRNSILAPKRQSILMTREAASEKKMVGPGLTVIDEAQEKAWKQKEASDKAEIENLKQYLTYYQQYEGLYQQQQQMLSEREAVINNLQKQSGSSGGSTGQIGGSSQLPPPNLLGGGSSTLPPPNLLGGGSSKTLPPPNLLGGGSNTLPPPNLLARGGSNTLPPPNLLGGGGLPPPNLLGGGSNTLPPPNLLGGGSNTLPPPNLLGGGSGGLPPPNLLGGGSGGLPPPNLLGGGGLPPPNLLGKGPGLPPPNLLGGSGGLPPRNLLGGPGGLPPPNLLGKGPGLPPPNLLGGSGGLPPPNLLGGPGGLPPPNLLGKGPGGLPPPNLLGGSGGLPPPNLLGGPGGLPPPNLLGKGPGGLPPPNLLGGGPGGLPPPNLLGKPGGMPPPNLLGGPPNLLGGPPNLLGGPPNLLGGPPNLLGGPPNLLGKGPGGLPPPNLSGGLKAPSLGGPPNLSLSKGPSLGGPPNLNLGGPSQPKKNYKPIFWEAVPPVKFNDTIWASAYQEQVEDLKFDDIEDMFLNAPPKTGGGGGGGAVQEQKKQEVISLIPDSKKAYNMNIMISKFKKYSNDQIRTAIQVMDPEILTLDACSTLLPFCPEPAEISAASTYDGEMSGLDPASQFIVAVHKIPRLQLRFKNFIFKGDFDEKLETLSRDVDVFKAGCVALTSNEHFRKFLKIALNIGNTLNAGTARGGAYGFKLASLVAFMNTKGNKPNLTLLSYIVQQVNSQRPEWLDFTSEFDKLVDVAKLNIDNLVKDIGGLKSQVQNLKGTIDMAGKGNPPDSGYVDTFQPFYDTAWPKVSACEIKANETKTLYVQTAKYLGEDDESLKKKTSEEFFGIFVNINSSIKKTVKDEEDRKKKEARMKK